MGVKRVHDNGSAHVRLHCALRAPAQVAEVQPAAQAFGDVHPSLTAMLLTRCYSALPAEAARSFLFHLELEASAADIIAGRGPGCGGAVAL